MSKNHAHCDTAIINNTLEKRALQLITIAIVGVVLCAMLTMLDNNLKIFSVLIVSLPFLMGCLYLAYKKKTRLSSELFVWILTALTLCTLWLSNGFFDIGLLALPCILIFSAMLLTGSCFIKVLTIFLCNIALMGYVHHNDIYTFNTAINEATRPALSIVLLGVMGIAVHILIKDYTHTIHNLGNEYAKVKASEKAIAFLANHDSLTELPNRTLANDRFDQAIQNLARNHSDNKIALIFMDLDNFKNINDSLGHDTGDSYLVAIAQRLRDATRASDTVCRLGGDEFLLILGGLNDERDVTNIVSIVQKHISRPVITGQHKLVCTASMGISIYPNDGKYYDELVKKADIAMYRSKEMGRNTFHYYCSSMNSDALDRMQLLEELRTALTNDELYVEYQPIILLASGKIVGAEALLRWQHPTRGLVGPDTFIPLAEKSGLIVDIGAWVLERACYDIADLQQKHSPNFHVAVNVSTLQLQRGDFQKRVKSILAKNPIAKHSLELEITESELLSNSPKFDAAITQLKAMGISLAIDDFGTGYSNLGYVQKIKVSKLKIDRSFVKGIDTHCDNQAIVRAVHNIAEGLVMNTVAEGVEHKHELAFLKKLGINHGQGYLWSRSVSISSLNKLIQEAA